MTKWKLYWRIFRQTLVIKEEIEPIQSKFLLDTDKTASKCNLLINISEKEMIDKVLTCDLIRCTYSTGAKPSNMLYYCYECRSVK